MHCPGCDGNSSDIARGFAEDGKCPECGLSLDTLNEINRVCESRATAEVKAQCEAWMVRAGKAEAERDRLQARLDRVREAMDSDYD